MAKKDNQILKQQIAQKDQQISTFQKQTQKQFDEIISLQENLGAAKDNAKNLIEEKMRLEKTLVDLKNENASLVQKQSKGPELSAEQYLEVLSREKDLTSLMHFTQLANAKYMQLMSQQYLENLSKAGPQMAGMGMPPASGQQMMFQQPVNNQFPMMFGQDYNRQ